MRDFVLNTQQQEGSQRCWRHNLACALSSELLAQVLWTDSGLAYTAGLLHDVGMLAMVATHTEQYAEIMHSGCSEPAVFLARERELLGIDHCEAGRWLLSDWGLPPEFTAVTAHHHDSLPREAPELTVLVQLGCEMAGMAGFSTCESGPAWDPDRIAERLPGKSGDRLHTKIEDFPMTIATKINSFDCDFLA